MTQMLSPRKRPKPPTIASSSPNLRSPDERNEIGDQRAHIVEAMGPLGMAGDLRLLPGRELGVEVLERLRRLGLEAGNLLADGGGAVARLECAQFLGLGLDLGHRFLEVEVAAHQAAQVPACGSVIVRVRGAAWLVLLLMAPLGHVS